MIIHNLNLKRIAPSPAKTDPPLIVDADAVLPLPFSLEGLQAVSGRGSKVAQLQSAIQQAELASSGSLNRSKSRDALAPMQSLRVSTAKRPDHLRIV